MIRRRRPRADANSDTSPCQNTAQRTFRTIFISDVHLGTRGCRAEQLLDFLRWHDADTIYLVGDIIDGWQLRHGWHWPQAHNDVVQKLLRKGRKGARLIYVPGNHDDFLRGYYGRHFGGVEVAPQVIHEGADGRRYIVMHGDQFDLVVKNARWLAFLGDHAYTLALALNTALNWVRRRFGLPYWSVSKWAKARVKEAVNYIGEFEKTLSIEADRHRTDGVICGHIHHAVIRRFARHLVRELRRLGRELLGGGRALQRRVRDPDLDVGDAAGCRGRRRHGGPGGLMRILIATDAWHPQVNGVLRTLMAVADALASIGETVRFLNHEGMPTIGLPTYRDIRLGLPRPGEVAQRIDAIAPDAIHVATEGPIGHLARRYCVRRGRPFTTSFHTRFADYAAARWPIPQELSWTWLRWFHNGGRATMASTPSLMDELTTRGFRKVLRWPRGVDSGLFRPREPALLDLPRPLFLSVGRVAVEKNLEAFLALDLPGTKMVVGDGPAREELALRYPNAIFLGKKQGEELAALYARRRRLRISEPH